MPWQICATFPDPETGRETTICIDIPVLLRGWPDHPHWISENVFDPSVAKDLIILATLDSLAATLNNTTIRKKVQTTIQGNVKQPLIKGAKIQFK